MKKLALLFLSLAMTNAFAATHLKVGDKAPNFSMPASTGDTVSLSDYAGKKTVVVAFFPAAFTGGWTKEAKAYQAGIAQFENAGAQVFLVSTDNVPTLRHWAGELGASYPFLSDFAERKAAKDYGVLIAERGIASRTTFVINQNGVITHIEEGGDAVDPSGALQACSRK